MKRNILYVALLAALALLTIVTGCSPSAPASSGGKAVNLDGTSWTLVSLNGQDLLADTEIMLDVNGDQFSGTAGCNRYFGSVTLADGGLSVGMWAAPRCGAPRPKV